MAKEIIDIYVEQGYPYDFNIDFNTVGNEDLEPSHTAYFYNEYIGTKTFDVISFDLLSNTYRLTLSAEDTGKINSNLSKYVVYAINNLTSEKDKLLTGRIILDRKVGV